MFTEDGVEAITGLAIDPKQGQLYFINPNGDRLERIPDSGGERQVFFKAEEVPTAVALDLVDRQVSVAYTLFCCQAKQRVGSTQRASSHHLLFF